MLSSVKTCLGAFGDLKFLILLLKARIKGRRLTLHLRWRFHEHRGPLERERASTEMFLPYGLGQEPCKTYQSLLKAWPGLWSQEEGEGGLSSWWPPKGSD